MRGIGIPIEYIELSRHIKVITEISKEDEAFVIKRIRPQNTLCNRLILGTPCEVETIKGEKVKITATIEGNKVVARGDIYNVTMEMIDENHLKEIIRYKDVTMSRISKRQ